jgi:hypothetical protein
MTYDPENPIMPRRNGLQIHEEMKSIQEQIGRLQYKLMRLQQELNNSNSKNNGSYTCSNTDTYIMFNNGSEIKPLPSEETIRGKGWFFGIDLGKEESE